MYIYSCCLWLRVGVYVVGDFNDCYCCSGFVVLDPRLEWTLKLLSIFDMFSKINWETKRIQFSVCVCV